MGAKTRTTYEKQLPKLKSKPEIYGVSYLSWHWPIPIVVAPVTFQPSPEDPLVRPGLKVLG